MLTQDQIDALKADGMVFTEDDKSLGQLKKMPVGNYLILLCATKERKLGKLEWQVAQVRPNLTIVGHVFIFDLSDDLLAYKRLMDT